MQIIICSPGLLVSFILLTTSSLSAEMLSGLFAYGGSLRFLQSLVINEGSTLSRAIVVYTKKDTCTAFACLYMVFACYGSYLLW